MSRVCGNPNITSTGISCKMKHNQKSTFALLVAASVIGTFVGVSTVAAICWAFTRKRQRGKGLSNIFSNINIRLDVCFFEQINLEKKKKNKTKQKQNKRAGK